MPLTGTVATFSKPNGYGFITSDASSSAEPARFFFHAKSVKGNVSMLKVGMAVTFDVEKDEAKGRTAAVNIRDASGNAIDVSRSTKKILASEVSAPGRRIGIVEANPKDGHKSVFATDIASGEKVYVPIRLLKGQQIEYTLTSGAKGARASDVTGPMGAPIEVAPAVLPKPEPKTAEEKAAKAAKKEKYIKRAADTSADARKAKRGPRTEGAPAKKKPSSQ